MGACNSQKMPKNIPKRATNKIQITRSKLQDKPKKKLNKEYGLLIKDTNIGNFSDRKEIIQPTVVEVKKQKEPIEIYMDENQALLKEKQEAISEKLVLFIGSYIFENITFIMEDVGKLYLGD